MKGNMQDWAPNVADIIEHASQQFPKREVISKTQSGELHRTNFRRVCVRAKKLASALERDGYKKGDILGTLALNGYRHLEIYYGISGMGCITHTLKFRLHPDQAVYIINHAQDKVIFCELAFVTILEAIQDKLPFLEKVIILCGQEELPKTPLKNIISYEQYIELGDVDYKWPKMQQNDACALCYTSGTTGDPKGVLYSHSSQVIHAKAGSFALELSGRDSMLIVVPMFHVCAWGLPYIAPMLGSKLVFPGMHMDGRSLFDLIDKEQVTLAFGVPTVWMQLLNYCRENKKKLSCVNKTVVGGAALSLPILKEFEEKHNVTVIHAWGMTEMSPVGTTNLETTEMSTMTKDKKYAIKLKQGKPCYGVQLKIVSDTGVELPRDGIARGHLMVRGPWILERYFKETKKVVDSLGWFDTGDIATLDEDGYMTIVDRAKDVVKSGGEWISSIDLENAAYEHPDIIEACVVGVPHSKWDERPLLFVVLKEGKSIEKQEIKDFLGLKVAKWWIPDDIIFVDELPHGATGKLQKFGLRREYSNHYSC